MFGGIKSKHTIAIIIIAWSCFLTKLGVIDTSTVPLETERYRVITIDAPEKLTDNAKHLPEAIKNITQICGKDKYCLLDKCWKDLPGYRLSQCLTRVNIKADVFSNDEIDHYVSVRTSQLKPHVVMRHDKPREKKDQQQKSQNGTNSHTNPHVNITNEHKAKHDKFNKPATPTPTTTSTTTTTTTPRSNKNIRTELEVQTIDPKLTKSVANISLSSSSVSPSLPPALPSSTLTKPLVPIKNNITNKNHITNLNNNPQKTNNTNIPIQDPETQPSSTSTISTTTTTTKLPTTTTIDQTISIITKTTTTTPKSIPSLHVSSSSSLLSSVSSSLSSSSQQSNSKPAATTTKNSTSKATSNSRNNSKPIANKTTSSTKLANDEQISKIVDDARQSNVKTFINATTKTSSSVDAINSLDTPLLHAKQLEDNLINVKQHDSIEMQHSSKVETNIINTSKESQKMSRPDSLPAFSQQTLLDTIKKLKVNETTSKLSTVSLPTSLNDTQKNITQNLNDELLQVFAARKEKKLQQHQHQEAANEIIPSKLQPMPTTTTTTTTKKPQIKPKTTTSTTTTTTTTKKPIPKETTTTTTTTKKPTPKSTTTTTTPASTFKSLAIPIPPPLPQISSSKPPIPPINKSKLNATKPIVPPKPINETVNLLTKTKTTATITTVPTITTTTIQKSLAIEPSSSTTESSSSTSTTPESSSSSSTTTTPIITTTTTTTTTPESPKLIKDIMIESDIYNKMTELDNTLDQFDANTANSNTTQQTIEENLYDIPTKDPYYDVPKSTLATNLLINITKSLVQDAINRPAPPTPRVTHVTVPETRAPAIPADHFSRITTPPSTTTTTTTTTSITRQPSFRVPTSELPELPPIFESVIPILPPLPPSSKSQKDDRNRQILHAQMFGFNSGRDQNEINPESGNLKVFERPSTPIPMTLTDQHENTPSNQRKKLNNILKFKSNNNNQAHSLQPLMPFPSLSLIVDSEESDEDYDSTLPPLLPLNAQEQTPEYKYQHSSTSNNHDEVFTHYLIPNNRNNPYQYYEQPITVYKPFQIIARMNPQDNMDGYDPKTNLFTGQTNNNNQPQSRYPPKPPPLPPTTTTTTTTTTTKRPTTTRRTTTTKRTTTTTTTTTTTPKPTTSTTTTIEPSHYNPDYNPYPLPGEPSYKNINYNTNNDEDSTTKYPETDPNWFRAAYEYLMEISYYIGAGLLAIKVFAIYKYNKYIRDKCCCCCKRKKPKTHFTKIVNHDINSIELENYPMRINTMDV